jgi:hypothetical protein
MLRLSNTPTNYEPKPGTILAVAGPRFHTRWNHGVPSTTRSVVRAIHWGANRTLGEATVPCPHTVSPFLVRICLLLPPMWLNTRRERSPPTRELLFSPSNRVPYLALQAPGPCERPAKEWQVAHAGATPRMQMLLTALNLMQALA